MSSWDRVKWQTRSGDSGTQIGGGWALGWVLGAKSWVRKVESRMWRDRALGKLVGLGLYLSSWSWLACDYPWRHLGFGRAGS